MYELSLKKAIQSLNMGKSEIKIGIVRSVSPLIITLKNDEKMSLGTASLCVPEHLKDFNMKISIEALGLENGNMRVHAALKNGDMVYLISADEGKKYIVIGRL